MNQKNMNSSQREIIRKKHLAENIVIIDDDQEIIDLLNEY
mgnify:CR=1 FL=1